jgi:hypothetical protein
MAAAFDVSFVYDLLIRSTCCAATQYKSQSLRLGTELPVGFLNPHGDDMDDVKHPIPKIRSASDDAAARTDTKNPTIRSASDEHAPKPGATMASTPRGSDQQLRPWPPKLSGSTSSGHHPDAGRAVDLGKALTLDYGTAFSEVLTFMSQSVERRNEMMSTLLQARGPQDVVRAGSHYLFNSWLAVFELNVRIVQTASRLSEDAKHSMTRTGA